MATFRQMKDEIVNEGCQLVLKQLFAYTMVGKVH